MAKATRFVPQTAKPGVLLELSYEEAKVLNAELANCGQSPVLDSVYNAVYDVLTETDDETNLEPF